jgi:hypothetical protein
MGNPLAVVAAEHSLEHQTYKTKRIIIEAMLEKFSANILYQLYLLFIRIHSIIYLLFALIEGNAFIQNSNLTSPKVSSVVLLHKYKSNRHFIVNNFFKKKNLKIFSNRNFTEFFIDFCILILSVINYYNFDFMKMI